MGLVFLFADRSSEMSQAQIYVMYMYSSVKKNAKGIHANQMCKQKIHSHIYVRSITYQKMILTEIHIVLNMITNAMAMIMIFKNQC